MHGTDNGVCGVKEAYAKKKWNTLKYHSEEITELYLGLAMIQEDRDDIVAKAKALNPHIVVFQARRGTNDKLVFDRI